MTGINVIEDVILTSKPIKYNYDNLRKIVITPRRGFVEESPQRICRQNAVNDGGFIVKGFIRKFINFATGETERVFYSGNHIERTVFDADLNPLENIIFQKSKDGKHFEAIVTEAGTNGETVRVMPDGKRITYSSEPFSIANNFSVLRRFFDF